MNPRANKTIRAHWQIPDTGKFKFKVSTALRALAPSFQQARVRRAVERLEPAASAAAVALAGKFRVTSKVGCGREAPSYGASMLAPWPMPVFRKRGNKQEKKVRTAGRREPATVAGLPLTARLRVPLS